MAVEPEALLGSHVTPAQAVEFVRSHAHGAPLVYSSAAPERVSSAQKKHGAELVARAVEAFFAEAARRLGAGGVRGWWSRAAKHRARWSRRWN